MASALHGVTSIVERLCVVCGFGSHRADWQGKEHPACDNHTQDEVVDAIAKVKAAQFDAEQPAPTPAAEPEPSEAESKVVAFLKMHGFNDGEINDTIHRHGIYALLHDAQAMGFGMPVKDEPAKETPAPSQPTGQDVTPPTAPAAS